MDDLKIPPIFVIVVGINEYMSPLFSPLDHWQAVDDAKALSTFLRDELNVPETNITELYDKNATKDAILTAISSLPSKDTFRPGNAVLFFFSGWAGKAPLHETNKPPTFIGMICPVDINVNTGKGQVQTGISDSTLVRLFDQISRSHGNNIVSKNISLGAIFH
jgi:hypothetical protein